MNKNTCNHWEVCFVVARHWARRSLPVVIYFISYNIPYNYLYIIYNIFDQTLPKRSRPSWPFWKTGWMSWDGRYIYILSGVWVCGPNTICMFIYPLCVGNGMTPENDKHWRLLGKVTWTNLWLKWTPNVRFWRLLLLGTTWQNYLEKSEWQKASQDSEDHTAWGTWRTSSTTGPGISMHPKTGLDQQIHNGGALMPWPCSSAEKPCWINGQ